MNRAGAELYKNANPNGIPLNRAFEIASIIKNVGQVIEDRPFMVRSLASDHDTVITTYVDPPEVPLVGGQPRLRVTGEAFLHVNLNVVLPLFPSTFKMRQEIMSLDIERMASYLLGLSVAEDGTDAAKERLKDMHELASKYARKES